MNEDKTREPEERRHDGAGAAWSLLCEQTAITTYLFTTEKISVKWLENWRAMSNHCQWSDAQKSDNSGAAAINMGK
jgi:hypothetical protein